jgi:histidinol-phosphate aminotransferase
MGTWHDAATVARMIEAVPEGTLLILDEAYVEFALEGTAPAIDPEDERVVRLRTFSKAYGMAGARVGYAVGAAPLITAFNKIRNHFGMARISQAGALASLTDTGWLPEVRGRVAEARDRIAAIGGAQGLTALPSATNFVSLDCGRDGDYARRVLKALIDKDIFVRMPFVAPQDRCIRISAGRPADLDAFAQALAEVLRAAG